MNKKCKKFDNEDEMILELIEECNLTPEEAEEALGNLIKILNE